MKGYEHQIRGLIALGVLLALIPLILFFAPALIRPKSPPFSESVPHRFAVEFADPEGISGIFFVEPDTRLHSLCVRLDIPVPEGGDVVLQNGMRVNWTSDSTVRIESMDAVKRLALGLPVDVNRASFEELQMIPGVGERRASDIMALREKKGRFKRLEELMQVKGIKEKTLAKLRLYLYVEEQPVL